MLIGNPVLIFKVYKENNEEKNKGEVQRKQSFSF